MKKHLIYLSIATFLIALLYLLSITIFSDVIDSYKLTSVRKQLDYLSQDSTEIMNKAEKLQKDHEAKIKELETVLNDNLKVLESQRKEISTKQESLFVKFNELNCKLYKECEKTQGSGNELFLKTKTQTQVQAPAQNQVKESPSPYGTHQAALESYNNQVRNFKDQWDVARDAW